MQIAQLLTNGIFTAPILSGLISGAKRNKTMIHRSSESSSHYFFPETLGKQRIFYDPLYAGSYHCAFGSFPPADM